MRKKGVSLCKCVGDGREFHCTALPTDACSFMEGVSTAEWVLCVYSRGSYCTNEAAYPEARRKYNQREGER